MKDIEILRLREMNLFTFRNIAASVGCSKTTAYKILLDVGNMVPFTRCVSYDTECFASTFYAANTEGQGVVRLLQR